MTDGIGTKVQLLGAVEYKKGLADMNRALTVLNTEMRASQSAFSGNEDSIEALTAKGESLQKLYDKQGEKVALIARQLEAAKGEYKENSVVVDNLQIALNRAQAAMNQTGAQLSENNSALEQASQRHETLTNATQQTTQAVEQEGSAADEAGDKTGRMSAALEKTGEVARASAQVALEALAAAFVAVGTAAAAAIAKTFQWSEQAGAMADEVLTLSAQTGVSADTLQRWSYASNFMDTSVETMTGGMARLIRQMGAAAGGSKTAQATFDALGVSIRDGNGNLRDSEDVFWDAIEALGAVGNETERDAMAMDIFGKSAQELNPLIETGRAQVQALGEEAELMGVVFSGDALSAMGSFDDSMQRFHQTLTGMENAIGLVAIPMFQPLVDKATSSMATISTALADGLQPGELDALADDLMVTLGEALTDISGLVEKGVPLLTKALKTMVSTSAKELPKLVGTLLPAATELLTALLDGVVDNSDEIGEMAVDLITSLVDFLLENAPKMVDAGGDLIENLIDGLLSGDSLSHIVTGAVEMLAKLAAALIRNAGVLLAKGPEIIGQLVQGLLEVDWANVALQLVSSLGDALASVFTNADEIAQVYEEQFGATQDAYDAFKLALDKADQNLASSQLDAESKKTLATELLSLYSQLEQKDVKTDADLTLMAGYAAQIAELYPSLGQYIDPTTGLFTANTEAIQQNINAMAQYALVQGYQEYLKTLGGELATLNLAIDEGTKSLQVQYDEWWRLQGALQSAQALYDTLDPNAGGGMTGFVENLTQVYDALSQINGVDQNPLNAFVNVLADGTVVLKDSADAATAYDTALNNLGGVVSTAQEAFNIQNTTFLQSQETLQGMQTDADATRGKIDGVIETIGAETNALNTMTDAAGAAGIAGRDAGAGINAGGDAALEGAGKVDQATQQLASGTDAASDAASGAEAAGDQIATTAEQILATAEDIQGAQTAAEAAQTKIAEIATSISEDAAAALTTMEEMAAAIVLTAEGMMASIDTAVTDSKTALAKAGTSAATALTLAIAALLTEAQGLLFGQAIGNGIQRGIDNSRSSVAGAGGNLARAAQAAMAAMVGSSGANFADIGEDMDSGVARGIRNYSGVIVAAARAAARAAYNAARDELDIHSPSHLMEEGVGAEYAEGFGLGIDNNRERVLQSARNLANLAASEATESGGFVPLQAPALTIDYARLGEEVAAANLRAGIGTGVWVMNGKVMAATMEPDVSRESYLRTVQSARGLAATKVLKG